MGRLAHARWPLTHFKVSNLCVSHDAVSANLLASDDEKENAMKKVWAKPQMQQVSASFEISRYQSCELKKK